MERRPAKLEQVLDWYTSLSNWGRWGPDDERGTLNLINDAKRREATSLVREGILISCARTIDYEATADATTPTRHFMITSGDAEPSEPFGRASAQDAFLITPHGLTITHLDAPSHVFFRPASSGPWQLYNGKPKERVSTERGATWGSVDQAGRGIVSRGVLLDIARLHNKPWLEEPVWPEDLDEAEAAEGVKVTAGDILFLRTGFPAERAEVGPRPRGAPRFGPQAACLPWLRDRDVALLASDTSNEVGPVREPGLAGAVHGVCLGAIGLWLLDNADFEALATECNRLGRWDFQAIIAPLKLANATGSPVNPLALL